MPRINGARAGHSDGLIEKCRELAQRARERFGDGYLGKAVGDSKEIADEVREFGEPIVEATRALSELSKKIPPVANRLGSMSLHVRIARLICLTLLMAIPLVAGYLVYRYGLLESWEAVKDHFVQISRGEDPYQPIDALFSIVLVIGAGVLMVLKLDEWDENRILRPIKVQLLRLSDEIDALTITMKAERLERPEDLNTESSPRLQVPPVFVEAFLRYANEAQRYIRAWCGVLMTEVSSESAREVLDDIRKGAIASAADIDRQRARAREIREQEMRELEVAAEKAGREQPQAAQAPTASAVEAPVPATPPATQHSGTQGG